MRLLEILFILLLLNNCAKAAKILSVFGYHRPSQYIFISPLLKALAERGHEVTSISMFPQKQKLKNFKDVSISENSQPFEAFLSETPKSRQRYSHFCEISQHSAKLEGTMIENVLDNPLVQELMLNETYDLILMRIVGAESLLGLGEYFQAPIIAISTWSTTSYIDYLVGNTSPPSYVPNIFLTLGSGTSFKHRILNLLTNLGYTLCHNYVVVPTQEKLYGKYFPSATRTFDEARKNVSLVLLNDHHCLSFPRPYVPNIIEVGGLHIKQQPVALPLELQDFLDQSKEGVIYFSLGSNVKSNYLNEEQLNIFIDTFQELKLKVLWKLEGNFIFPQKSENIFISKWLPQQDILAHDHVKLFITHGGKLSIAEAVFHAKPILGLPTGLDQPLNVENSVKAGYGLSLSMEDLNRESLKSNIEEMLTNPRYSETAQRLSKCFRDQPLSPLETAVYWVEYVLRHKGAVHMSNAGQALSFWQYHNLDVYAVLLGFIVMLACLSTMMGRLLFKWLYGNKKGNKTKLKIK